MKILKKHCKKCSIELTEKNAGYNSPLKDGSLPLRSKCKKCRSASDKEYWKINENRLRRNANNRARSARSKSLGKDLIKSLTEAVNEDTRETKRIG